MSGIEPGCEARTLTMRYAVPQEEMFTVSEFKWMLAGQINERVCHF